MARHGEHVVPIWQTDPRPEHAAGGRAIIKRPSTFFVRAAVAAVSWNRRSRITTSWSRTFKTSAIAAAFLFLTRSVLSTRAKPDTRPSDGQNQQDIILLKIVIACGCFDCPFGTCHYGILGQISVQIGLGPCRGQSGPNNFNNSECCWMFVALRRFALEREGRPRAGDPLQHWLTQCKDERLSATKAPEKRRLSLAVIAVISGY